LPPKADIAESATSRLRPNNLGWRASKYFGDLTGNATVVIIGQGPQSGGAIARKRWTVHKCQCVGREIGEAADRGAPPGIEARILEHVLRGDRRPDNIAVGQRTVIAKLGEQVAAHQSARRLLVEHAGVPAMRDVRRVDAAYAADARPFLSAFPLNHFVRQPLALAR